MKSVINKYLPAGQMKRNVIILSGVTLFGQALSVLLSPIWTRLYSPSDYGIYGAYNSVSQTIMAIAALSYEQAIPIAKDDNAALDLLVLATLVVATIGSISSIMLFLAGDKILQWTNLSIMKPYIWLIPLGALWSGTYQSLNYYALRKKTISLIAKTKVLQIVGSQVTIGTFAVLKPSPFGFIVSGLISDSAGIKTLAQNINLKFHGGIRKFVEARQLKLAFTRYWRFPLIATPSTLLNRAGLFLPAILMASYYGVESAGYFVLADRFIALPMQLVGGAVAQVFQSEASAIIRNEPIKLKSLLDKITKKTIKVSLLILALGAAAPFLFPIVFGPKWKISGELALYLSFYCAIGINASPISALPALVQRMNFQLILNGARALLVFLAFYIPFSMGMKAQKAVLCYSVIMIIYYLACYIYYRYLVINVAKSN